MLVPSTAALAGCNIRENGNCVDPNLQPGRSAGSGSGVITIPKEIHTLNDAILAAAKELSTRPKGRRRIIYVISDGKEYGSKATFKEVCAISRPTRSPSMARWWATSARWGEGYISRLHLPFTMYDNILSKYTRPPAARSTRRALNGIEKSYPRSPRKRATSTRWATTATSDSSTASSARSMCASTARPRSDRQERLLPLRAGCSLASEWFGKRGRPGTAVGRHLGRLGLCRRSGRAPRSRPAGSRLRPHLLITRAAGLCLRYAPGRCPALPPSSMPRWAALRVRWRWPSFIARWPWAPWD
jgi:hypothetical protein